MRTHRHPGPRRGGRQAAEAAQGCTSFLPRLCLPCPYHLLCQVSKGKLLSKWWRRRVIGASAETTPVSASPVIQPSFPATDARLSKPICEQATSRLESNFFFQKSWQVANSLFCSRFYDCVMIYLCAGRGPAGGAKKAHGAVGLRQHAGGRARQRRGPMRVSGVRAGGSGSQLDALHGQVHLGFLPADSEARCASLARWWRRS